ncbi:MAG TPA: DegQ family serine endoprotease [Desulfobulbus sp.]|nr:DegQ family serine endoprotease [Desulfobulbus sp.]
MIPQRRNPVLPALTALVFLITSLAATSVFADDNANIQLLARTAKAFASIVKKAEPAVVHVAVEKSVKGGGNAPANPFDFFSDPFFQRFFGPQFRHPRMNPRQQPRQFKQWAAGSGFIISPDGYIMTNNHVVENADKITVRLNDKREFKAKVIGTDPQSDVAVIKIDARNLPVLPLGDSDKIQVGEWVIAIGSPFELNETVTVGVVSAKGRNRMGINDYENFIQTDAAINPGNSGGPLLNIYGQVIGINTAIFSRSGGYMGIGFAIPINMAKNIEQQLRKYGKVTRGWLGVVIQDLDEDLAHSFGLDRPEGALVSQVSPNSPAAKAGLRQGDVLVTYNGSKLTNVADLRNKVAMTTPGTKVTMGLIRDGRKREVQVTIGQQPSDFSSRVGMAAPGNPLAKMGLSLQDLTPELADHFGYKVGQGVLVTEVAPGSPAERVGMQAGQLIEEVNKQRVRNLQDLEKALKRSKNPKEVLLRVRAGDFSQYVVLRAE